MTGRARSRRLLWPFLAILMTACTQPQPEATDSAPHPLVGRWTTDDVLVFYDATGRNLDARTFRITADDWGDVLGLAPRQVAFAADGTYWSEQRGVDGSVVERTSGRWAANDATLTLIQLVPDQAQLSYQYTVEESRLTFESQLDWDSDGAKDDYYVSRGRRVAGN